MSAVNRRVAETREYVEDESVKERQEEREELRQETAEFESIVELMRLKDRNQQDAPSNDNVNSDEDLKEMVLDSLLAFLSGNEDDPYFILNVFQRLRKVKPDNRVKLLDAISRLQPANSDDEAVDNKDEQNDEQEEQAPSVKEENELTLEMLRQFQQFTMDIVRTRYEIDEETEKELSESVEQLILDYVGLDAGEYMDELLDALNEILVGTGLQPRQEIIEAERSFQEEFPAIVKEAEDDNAVDQEQINVQWVDTARPSDEQEDLHAAVTNNADPQVINNWVSSAQATAVQEAEMTEKMTKEDLKNLKQLVENELAREVYNDLIQEAAESLQNAQLIED